MTNSYDIPMAFLYLFESLLDALFILMCMFMQSFFSLADSSSPL